MELPDFWLVAWVILVLDLCFYSVLSIFMLPCVLMEGELIVLRFGFLLIRKTSIQKTTNG